MIQHVNEPNGIEFGNRTRFTSWACYFMKLIYIRLSFCVKELCIKYVDTSLGV